MIELKHLLIGFGNHLLLDDVSTIFASNSLTALIGRNGSGKSTLLKTISGLNNKYLGEIFIQKHNLKSLSNSEKAKIIAYVNTARPRISNLRCRDVVALGRSPHTRWDGKLSKKDNEIVEEAINMVGMETYCDRYFHSLSDGECQKIMIARAISQSTEIILLDEPSSFLDLPTRYELAEMLKKLAHKNGKTIVFSTHEIDIALKFSDNIALFDSPNLINLPAEEMDRQKHVDRLFNLNPMG